MIKLLFIAVMLLQSQAKASCQAHDDHESIDQLCGTDMPINNTIFYENTSQEPIVLWRVYNTSYPQSAMGRWWSLDDPTKSSKDEYRQANAICPEWSPLDGIAKCELRPGGDFVIGHTDAVRCKTVNYLASDTLQIFLVNPLEDLYNCTVSDWED